jgi:hypothetical protein
MPDSTEAIILHAISTKSVRIKGPLTQPRSYGVYAITANYGVTRRYHFGNYPVRMRELVKQFGNCTLEYLFLSRNEAKKLASMLNTHQA